MKRKAPILNGTSLSTLGRFCRQIWTWLHRFGKTKCSRSKACCYWRYCRRDRWLPEMGSDTRLMPVFMGLFLKEVPFAPILYAAGACLWVGAVAAAEVSPAEKVVREFMAALEVGDTHKAYSLTAVPYHELISDEEFQLLLARRFPLIPEQNHQITSSVDRLKFAGLTVTREDSDYVNFRCVIFNDMRDLASFSQVTTTKLAADKIQQDVSECKGALAVEKNTERRSLIEEMMDAIKKGKPVNVHRGTLLAVKSRDGTQCKVLPFLGIKRTSGVTCNLQTREGTASSAGPTWTWLTLEETNQPIHFEMVWRLLVDPKACRICNLSFEDPTWKYCPQCGERIEE